MILLGILLGLCAALAQSATYVFSRLFVLRRPRGTFRLLAVNHVLMGLISALAFPFLLAGGLPPFKAVAFPLFTAAVFYLLGQTLLFLLLRRNDASRISPLLGIKILVLAVIAAAVQHQHLTAPMWLAAGLVVVASIELGNTGGRLSLGTYAGILLACLSYSLSDIHIRHLVFAIDPQAGLRSLLVAVCLSYLLTGIVGVLLLPRAWPLSMADVAYALPVSISWLLAMVFLYGCFATIGVVYGNIVQSMRGLISILLGAHLAFMGMRDLEAHTSRRVLLRRLAAALMMSAAIALYFFGLQG